MLSMRHPNYDWWGDNTYIVTSKCAVSILGPWNVIKYMYLVVSVLRADCKHVQLEEGYFK